MLLCIFITILLGAPLNHGPPFWHMSLSREKKPQVGGESEEYYPASRGMDYNFRGFQLLANTGLLFFCLL